MTKYTTIRISQETLKKLQTHLNKTMTYDEGISRMLDAVEE